MQNHLNYCTHFNEEINLFKCSVFKVVKYKVHEVPGSQCTARGRRGGGSQFIFNDANSLKHQ